MKSLNLFLHKKTLYKKRNALLSFFIPFFIMLIIFAARHIYPFGDESFLHSDMYHQYMPFFSELMHKLKTGESLSYSWNVGLGSNFLALFVYYLASPFNWFVVLVPEALLMEFMSYLIIVKIALCGLSFGIYLRRHFHTDSYMTVLFSTFYALSGFIAAYNWDIMWLDNIILAPLIILGLEQLVLEKKYMLYCLTLALSILSNYYLSIMICIYVVLYFFVLIATNPGKWKAVFPFTLYSLLAGGLSCVLLIPEVFALHFTEFSKFNFPDKVTSYFSIIDMLARHFVNVTTEQGLNHWPNIYCGVAVLLLLPLYIMNRKIRLSEKIAKVILLFFLLISFSTNVLNFLWHGLNYPDSLPCRQSFLYILLLLTICYEAFSKLDGVSERKIILTFWGSIFFVMICERIVDNKAAFPFGAFLATYILLAVYAGLLWLCRCTSFVKEKTSVAPVSQEYSHARSSLTRLLALLATFFIIMESAMNMAVTSVSTTSRSKYLASHNEYHTLVNRTRENDSDFYRFEKFSRVTKNDGALIGYPTASLFSSTGNSYVGDFYEKMGMSYSKVFYCFDGATPLTSALLSVRYMFSTSAEEAQGTLYELIDSENGLYLYRNKYSLPLGYMVSRGYDVLNEAAGMIPDAAQTYNDFTPLETQNRMAAALTDSPALFLPVSTTLEGSATTIDISQPGYYYAYINNSSVKTALAEINGKRTEFKRLNHNHILNLGYIEAGSEVTLTAKDNKDLLLSAYRMNEDTLADVISVLNEQTLVIDSFDEDSVRGHIQVTTPGNLILSIPYEPGWTLKIDGIETDMERFANAFISIPLKEGGHTIELSYYPAGLKLGIAMSLVSFTVLLGIFGIHRKRK